MKTLNKIIMAILLMASFASCSNIKEPKVVSSEEFKNILGEQMIKATFDDGMIMSFQVKSPSEVSVFSYKKIPTSGCVTIPSKIISNGVTYQVVEIRPLAFQRCKSMNFVTIPHSVTSIGDNAFIDCNGLTSVTIPKEVTSAGFGIFSYCTGLTSVIIEKGVTEIWESAFSGCTGLTSVSIPKSVTSIGGRAFADCTGLTSVSIPKSVTSIGERAFAGCSGLTSVSIQNQNISFDYDNVFAYCDKLQPSNEVLLSDASNDVKGPTKEYEWIAGTWACDMGPYGNVVVKFDGDGSSGTCTEAQYGSYKTGTYYVSGNTLCYKLNGESVTTTIEIESGHRLAAGGGYYYHKRDNGDEQRNEANDNSKTNIPNGATKGIFSVGYSQQVYFAKGNLQYRASSGTWRFANNQWETMGQANVNISANYSGWIDLFGWGTGNDPYNHSENNDDYATFCDWGSYGMGDGWRTPTTEEWNYLFTGRSDANNKFSAAFVNGVAGLVVLPDDWVLPSGLSFHHSFDYSQNSYDNASWSRMEEAGAIFLPAAGRRTGKSMYNSGSDCDYWSSTPNGSTKAFNVDLTKGKKLISRDDSPRKHGFAVRLIKNI